MKSILDLPLGENVIGATTVREYLKALLTELWTETEQFSGKRPFGDGNWQACVYASLISAGYVKGEIVDGFIDSVDYKAADALILAAIRSL